MKAEFRRGASTAKHKDQRQADGVEHVAKQVQPQLALEGAGQAGEAAEAEEASVAFAQRARSTYCRRARGVRG